MPTYGKKKRTILPPISTLQGFVDVRRQDNQYGLLRGNGGNRRAHRGFQNGQTFPRHISRSKHTDAVDEVASMLLDDTVLESENGNTSSDAQDKHPRPSSTYTKTAISSRTTNDVKSEPDFPSVQPSLNVDKTPIAMYERPAYELAHRISSGNNDVTHTTQSLHGQNGDSDKPPVPRRSSRRRFTTPYMHLSESTPSFSGTSGTSDELGGLDLEVRVQGGDQVRAIHGSNEVSKLFQVKQQRTSRLLAGDKAVTSAKKQHLKKNKVLLKVKTAITDHFTRSRVDSALDDRLLDNCVDASGEDEVALWKNGTNLNEDLFSKKTQNAPKDPGDRCERWEPKSDDEGSLHVPNSKISHSLCTSNAKALKPIMIEAKAIKAPENESSHDLAISRSSLKDLQHYSSDDSALPSNINTPKKQLRHSKKSASLCFEAEFDALFSSSPLGHSTPRIRLEPTEDDGRRVLRSVSADLPSVFDSAMDVDSDSGSDDPFGSSQVTLRRRKKHPSPSKKELEELEKAMSQFEVFPKAPKERSKIEKTTRRFSKHLAPVGVLGKRDANVRLTQSKTASKIGAKLNQLTSAKHTSSVSGIPTLSSERQKGTNSNRGNHDLKSTISANKKVVDDAMEIDELQWDDSAYNIGMGRV